MAKVMKFKVRSRAAAHHDDYRACIADLLAHESVQKMEGFRHHYRTNCLAHSLNVSYLSYRICKTLKMDHRSAARGALLHDLFLYDWRDTELEEGRHAFIHPFIALRNARKVSRLNEIEQDIVVKHMWPLTSKPPRYRESMVVCMVDKLCSTLELSLGQNGLLPSARLDLPVSAAVPARAS